MQVTENSQFDALSAQLINDDHLAPESMPAAFRMVPDDAPELRHVLEELDHKIAEFPEELPDAWGAILITEKQDGLRRMDIAISWDGVLIENGQVQTGPDGEPLPLMETVEIDDQMVEQRVRRLQTAHIFLHEDSAYFD
jgi:hypothetical protein